MKTFKIAPSVLSADYANFETELKKLEASGAEYAHLDVMDGHFVPNISFGAGVVASMRPHSKMVFDCHLMVSNLNTILRNLLGQEQILSASMWKRHRIFMELCRRFVRQVSSLVLLSILEHRLKRLKMS